MNQYMTLLAIKVNKRNITVTVFHGLFDDTPQMGCRLIYKIHVTVLIKSYLSLEGTEPASPSYMSYTLQTELHGPDYKSQM